MRSPLANPWFQLAGLVAVVSGGISAYNEATTGAYSGTPRLPDTTAMQSPAPANTAASPGDPSTVFYAPQLGVDLAAMTKTASGLLYRDLIPGTGTVADSTSRVTVTWTSWLPDGTRVAGSPPTGPDEFQLGRGSLIAGFEEGLRGMKAGGKRQVVIPANLGFGATGAAGIPPNSVTVYELELVSAVPDAPQAATSSVPAGPTVAAPAVAIAPGMVQPFGGAAAVASYEGPGTPSVALAPDGTTLAAGIYEGRVTIYDTRTGGFVHKLYGHKAGVRSVNYSPDGSLLASGSEDSTVRVWDPRAGKVIRTLRGTGGIAQYVTFSPDGQLLGAAREDGSITLWEAKTGNLVRTLPALEQLRNNCVAFSPDGKLVASGDIAGIMTVRAVADGEVRRRFDTEGQLVSSVSFSPDGRMVASGTERDLRLWDLESGRRIRTLDAHYGFFSPDGRTVLTNGRDVRTVTVWDVTTGQALQTLRVGKGSNGGDLDIVNDIAWSRDGGTFTAGIVFGTITVWRVGGGPPVPAPAPVSSLALTARALPPVVLRSPRGTLRGVAFPEPGIVVVAGDNGIFRSTDGGSTWTPRPVGWTGGFGVVAFADRSTGVAVASYWGPPRRTTDGGVTWTPQRAGSEILHGIRFRGDAGYAVGSGGAIRRTSDRGATWTPIDVGMKHFFFDVAVIDANTATIVGDTGVILRTTSGGTQWTAQRSGTRQPLRAVFFSDASTGVAVGASGTILRTTDGGATWTAQRSGIISELLAAHFISPTTGHVAGDKGTLLRTTDGGATWTPLSTGTSEWLQAIEFSDPANGMIVGTNATILRTSNGGATWAR